MFTFDTTTSETYKNTQLLTFKHSISICTDFYIWAHFNRECLTKTYTFFSKKKRARPGELSEEVYNVWKYICLDYLHVIEKKYRLVANIDLFKVINFKVNNFIFVVNKNSMPQKKTWYRRNIVIILCYISIPKTVFMFCTRK